MKRCVKGVLLAAGMVSLCAGGTSVAQTDDGPATVKALGEPDMAALIKADGIRESSQPVREILKNWHRPKKVVVFTDKNPGRLAWLREVVPADVKLVEVKNTEQGLKEVADADAVITRSCTKAMINAAGPNFEWMHVNTTGVEGCFTGDPIPEKIKPDGTVVVTNRTRIDGLAVGYHGFALMVALSRGLEVYARRDDRGNYPPFDHNQFWEMNGRTVLVVGLGGIGSVFAKHAHDLGMHVIATNGSIPNPLPAYVEHVGLPGDLLDLAPKADVVVSCVPLTTTTTGMFNAAFFAKMKRGAMFLNITRDKVVVEPDLVAAIKSGQVGSAGLDDYDRRPDNPLYALPTVLLTPHTGAQDGLEVNGAEDAWALARENLRRFVNGDKLLSLVDPAKGY